MQTQDEVSAAEAEYFEALLGGSRSRLEQVLGPDFILIDVMTGSEIPREVLVDLVGTGQLVFDSIERLEARARLHGDSAIVTGATRMSGHYGNQGFQAHSRYTHVYVHGQDGWRLVTAQGTPIAPVPV